MIPARTRPARTRCIAKLDRAAPRPTEVTLDRAAGLFVVRHVGRRRRFELEIEVVAQMVAERVVHADLKKARREKALARAARRKGS